MNDVTVDKEYKTYAILFAYYLKVLLAEHICRHFIATSILSKKWCKHNKVALETVILNSQNSQGKQKP